jgi:protein SCO1/2
MPFTAVAPAARVLQMRRYTQALRWLAALLVIASSAGCTGAQKYELRGQVLAIDPSRREITIKHEDIRGFMPGMTMPFKVRDARLLDGRSAGELITATLVVEDSEGYLESIAAVGRAPLTDTVRPRRDPLSTGDLVPDVRLVDESGRETPLSAWRGRTVAVTFIYTRCPIPDFCPAIDRRFADAQAQLLKEPELRGAVHLLSISFDPEFDTPAILAAHAKKLGADPAVWSFMTGSRAEIEAFAANFAVQIMRDDRATDIMHNLRTAVISPDGRLRAVLGGSDWQAADLIEALRQARHAQGPRGDR